jgi:hypothetical protein
LESYKNPENVERVFRGLNTDLLILPIRHQLGARVLIRMPAYYVTWRMQQKLARSCSKTTTPPPPAPPFVNRRRPWAWLISARPGTGLSRPRVSGHDR